MASKESTAIDSDAASIGEWAASCASSVCGHDFEAERDETLFILDWDDTICPTTHHEVNPQCREVEASELEDHARAVDALLRVAAGVGHVCIVTMASNAWLEESIAELLPSVGETVEELQIPVVLAKVGVPTRCMREAFADGRSPSHYLKRRAMAKVIRENARSRRGGWKHIVSIGDSEAEQHALQDVMMGRAPFDREGGWSRCHCKTVKLKSEPTLEELTAQLRILSQWLPTIARHDGDLDFDVDEECD